MNVIARAFVKKTIQQLFLSLTALGLVTAASSAQAQTTNIYYFQETGWTMGGILKGSFTAVDANNDGAVDIGVIYPAGNTTEIFDFSAAFYTDSDPVNPVYTVGNDAIPGKLAILYEYNNGPDWGDGSALGASAQEQFFFESDDSYVVAAGLGQLGSIGGLSYHSGFDPNGLDTTTLDPVITSVVPYPLSVPEPATLALAGLGGLSLLIFRRRQA